MRALPPTHAGLHPSSRFLTIPLSYIPHLDGAPPVHVSTPSTLSRLSHLPHTHGAPPSTTRPMRLRTSFPPPRRGSTRDPRQSPIRQAVSPALAGIHRSTCNRQRLPSRLPHTCGALPVLVATMDSKAEVPSTPMGIHRRRCCPDFRWSSPRVSGAPPSARRSRRGPWKSPPASAGIHLPHTEPSYGTLPSPDFMGIHRDPLVATQHHPVIPRLGGAPPTRQFDGTAVQTSPTTHKACGAPPFLPLHAMFMTATPTTL